MCGIVGIIGKENVVPKLIDGLKKLEYRGYDSAGIAVINDGLIRDVRQIGKVIELEKKVHSKHVEGLIGIAHTRWATHGKPTELNAHPHRSFDGKVAVVHNGIIENYKDLKIKLMGDGYEFKSETDTEVIPNLIAYYLSRGNDRKKSLIKAVNDFEGAYSIAAIFADDPNHIYMAKNGTPMVLGIGEEEMYVSSGLLAFAPYTKKAITLEDNEMAILGRDSLEIFDNSGKAINKIPEIIDVEDAIVDKGEFPHFMLKEIYEQPSVLRRTVKEYIDLEHKKIHLPKFPFPLEDLERITISACGTSFYSANIGKYFIEKLAGINVDVDIASEFRYRSTPLKPGNAALFISQSGETADTIAALKYCKEQGQKIISIVNVFHSSMSSLSDVVVKTMAGTEVGVASTKALMGQMAVIYLLGVEIAFVKGKITKAEYEKFIDDLVGVADILEAYLVDKNLNDLDNIGKEIMMQEFLLYVGRGIFYPMALEGALKINELSYIPSIGIAAGELKHGPLAVVDKNRYIFAINPSGELFDKTASNIEEIVSREGKVIMIGDTDSIKHMADKLHGHLEIPKADNHFISCFYCLLPLQLLAYYAALHRGNNIDKPRNLAKSVTVE